jgi:hypothetical protein
MLAVLMACARDGQRRPRLAESADLIWSGLRMRLRPSLPQSARTVRAAVRLMYAGAAVSTANLIITLAYTLAAVAGGARPVHSSLTVVPFIALLFVLSLVPVVPVLVWLWMARAAGPGPELGARSVHGAVRPGHAGADRGDHGPGIQLQRDGVQPGLPGADLAGRPRRGVAALAPGLEHIFQAAGLVARRAERIAVFRDLIIQFMQNPAYY